MKSYILITSADPFKMELADNYYGSEKLKTEILIELESFSLPEIKNKELWLHENFKIKITDNAKVATGLSINHLSLDSIDYDYNLAEIIFVLNEGAKIFGHRIILKRKNTKLALDIIDGINLLSLIKLNDNLISITEIKTSP
jgi:hypothetical protein